MPLKIKKHRSKLKYIVLLLLAVFLLANRGFRSLIKNSLEYRRLKNRRIELELEKSSLENRLKIMNEPGQIEETARKELGLIRPNEIEYRFTPPKKDD